MLYALSVNKDDLVLDLSLVHSKKLAYTQVDDYKQLLDEVLRYPE